MGDSLAWLRHLRLLGPNIKGDVDDELRFHLEMRTRELEASGVPPAEARREAERQFGNVSSIRAACLTIDERRFRRHQRRERMGDFMSDIRLALRALQRTPAFTVMALLCLALGVAATTTIFSAVRSILLRPLPYADAERLVAVYARYQARDEHGVNISYPDYVDWRDRTSSFSQLGLYTWGSYTLSGDGEAERLDGATVTANLFPLLGVSPIVGRTFDASDQQPGRDRVILLSYGLWQRRFAGDRSVVGRGITVNGLPYTVIGVMPPVFNFPDRGQAWTPFVPEDWMLRRDNRALAGAIGRLKPGVSIEQAQRDFDVLSKNLANTYPNENFGWDAEAISLRDDLVGDLRRPLLIFQGAVAFVLLIACANVANLMLARGMSRRRELAVRMAIGAGRRRIVRQFLTESLVLALIGGGAGALLSIVGVRLLRLAFPDDVPFYLSLGVDWYALAFAAVVAMLTGVLFGLVPALRAARVDASDALREGSRGDSAGKRSHRLRRALVISEVALSLILLVGATLLLRSYRAYMSTDLGFDEKGVLSARISLPDTKYSTAEQRRAYYEQLYARLAALPGVTRVGSANGIPFSGWNVKAEFSIEGRAARAQGDELDVHNQNISPDYLESIGSRIVRGRGFTNADRDSAAHIGIINEVLAQREFGKEDPIGQRMKVGGVDSKNPWITIVGVSRTFRHYQLPQPMGPAIYYPQLAMPTYSQSIVLRTTLSDPTSLAPALRSTLLSLDPDVPPYQVQSFEQVVSRSLWRQRLQGQVLGTFAALALLLAVVGMYGVISYAVAQRTRELGVRMALGATRRDVLMMVLAEGGQMAAAGVIIGIAGALALSRLVAGLLYEVRPTDPLTFIVVPLALALTALIASWIPARRATRVNPVVAMRSD